MKSLNEVAKAVADGTLSDSSLIKANQIFKWRTSFEPDNKYNIIKAKTFNNFKNGIDNSQSLIKALIVGETKVVDGVTYVVKQIGKSGKLDWRVANKQSKANNQNQKVNLDTLFDTQDFPTKTSDLKFKSALGGSTGAQLMEDAQGTLFVLKKGASKSHVEEEFLTNCIYKLMNVQVPIVKLYEENGVTSMVSKFIPDTTPINNVLDEQYIDDMTEHYVLDCLLANWDIYKNDNILVNNDNDDIIRVDNGGGLRYSAQGRDKGAHFTDDVDEIETMLVNNPNLASGVTTKKINNQIKSIVKNKNKILSLIDDVALKHKMSMRIASLDMRLQNANLPLDPYRDLTDKELEKAMKVCKDDLFATNDVEGWIFLSQIAKMRGFDGTPTIVDSKDFDKLLKDKDTVHINRGLTAYNNKTAKALMNDFVESEHCFYGKQAMYGAGIYGAVNSKKKNGKGNEDWELVHSNYAGYDENHILDIILPSDMKIADGDELDKMMMEEFFGDEFKEAKKEYDEAVENINRLKLEKQGLEKEIEDGVKKDLGWDEKTYQILQKSRPEEVYADTTKFKFEKILRYFSPILKNINGNINKIDDLNYEIQLPNSSDTFILNRNAVESKDALKKKGDGYKAYNYQYKLMKEYIMKEHFHNIVKKVHEKISFEHKNNDDLKQIKVDISDSEKAIKALSDNIDKLKTTGSNTMNSVMAKIAQRPGGEFRGFYAAIKGYDAIIQKKGWGGNTDFCVILNRSKVIVKDFK
jgi:hypothetical protein